MDDFGNLVILCILMFGLTYIIGYLPMIFKLSQKRLESISIFGAGFLLGTALIVIVPEGLSVLMETSGILQPNHTTHDPHIHHNHIHHHRVPTNIEQEIYKQLTDDIDIQNINADLQEENVHVLQENNFQTRRTRRNILHEQNPIILIQDDEDDNNHDSDEHDHDENGHHHHTHDPIVHSVFRKMGCLICFG